MVPAFRSNSTSGREVKIEAFLEEQSATEKTPLTDGDTKENADSSKVCEPSTQADANQQSSSIDIHPTRVHHQSSQSNMSPSKIAMLATAWGYCVISWLCGVTQDFSTLDVMPGTPLHWQMTRSALHTLEDMRSRQCWFAFCALGFFSVVIPTTKLSGTGYLIYQLKDKRSYVVYKEHCKKIHAFSYFASYQFADLYCGMLFVCFFTSEASTTKFGNGFYCFFTYCVCSLILSVVLDRILIDDEHTHKSEDNITSPVVDTEQESSRNAVGATGKSLAEVGPQDAEAQRPLCQFNLRPKASQHQDIFPDLMATRFFAIWFMLMFTICPWENFLEVRMLVHGIAVERTVMSLKQVMCDLLPGKIHYIVIFVLWCLTLLCPVAYALAQWARVEHRHRYKNAESITFAGVTVAGDVFQSRAKFFVELFRQWSHVDVVAIAAIIFLFMIQDSTTLTMVPDGSYAFYIFLAAGFAFFFLRWCVEHEPGEQFLGLASLKAKAIALVVVYFSFLAVVCGGVPGAAPHFQYRDLDSICKHAMPFLSKVRKQLPASYGNCKDKDSHPPQPCMGADNLETSGDKKNYMNAIWIGGLRTIEVSHCKVRPVTNPSPGMSKYNFVIAGKFGKLPLFLRVQECFSVGGCVEMNSAKHCCGKDVAFNFTFGIDCKTIPGSLNAIRGLELVDASFGAMIVHQDMLGGYVHLDAIDISGQVAATVKSHILKMLHSSFSWGGHACSMVDMMNKLVQYNAPADMGKCLK